MSLDYRSTVDESSVVSFQLDQEEFTVKFDETTTLESLKNQLENGTYTEVEFNHCAQIPVDQLCELIPLVNSNLKSLIIRDTAWINDECIELLTSYCSRLYKIELHGSLIGITRSGIESVGRNCGALLSLSIVSTTQNTMVNGALGIEKPWLLDNRIFPALINNLNSKLRHFCISGFNNLTADALEKFLSYFRKTLQSIDFSELSLINDFILKCIGDYCTNLFVVKLNNSKNITDGGIKDFMRKRTNLEVLELCGCAKITDVSCIAIAQNCPKLTIVKLDSCNQVTEISLNAFAMNCKKLTYISMKNCALKTIPCSMVHLQYLNYLNVEGCNITFPPKEVLSDDINVLQEFLRDYDITNCIRCFLLGGSQTGKSSIIYALKGEHSNVSDGETFGIPVTRWFPYMANNIVQRRSSDENSSTQSLEIWDCSGRKALEGVHGFFMNRRTVYIVTFNLSIYSSVEKVPKWIGTVQAKAPGAYIIIVASHKDLSTEEKIKHACQRVMDKVKEQEENSISQIKEELMFLRELGLFSMISSKRRKLEWMFENRPRIHDKVIAVSSINGEGIDELQQVLLSVISNTEIYPAYTVSNTLEKLYFEICTNMKKGIVIMTWEDIWKMATNVDLTDSKIVMKCMIQLEALGRVNFLGENVSLLSFDSINSHENHEQADLNELVCINPPLLASAVSSIHRNEKNVQDLVDLLTRGGHIDALWTDKKPYDWTLRNTFSNITSNGMIRESIIPLLLYNLKLPLDQFQLVVQALQQMLVIISGAPNASYNVELVIPNLKSLSVYKRYFLPLQGILPVIPQVNAWLPKCPSTHIQVGWDYRFVSPVPTYLFLLLISACTVVKESSEILSYWQTGSYIRIGDVDVSVCQWKDKLVIQLLARTKLVNGARQAVNKAWCCLASYFYRIDKILSVYPGLYYEVLTVNNAQCKPILEIIDEYEGGDINPSDVLWFIPLKGCTRNSIRPTFIPPNYFAWLKSISEQANIHLSHTPELTYELKPIVTFLMAAGYHVTSDEKQEDGINEARLILCILTTSYFEQDKLSNVKKNLNEKKILLATLEQDLTTDHLGHEDILLNKVKVDISGGIGSGSSYRPDTNELKKLVEICNTTVFGQGALGDELKRGSFTNSIFTNANNPNSSSLNKPFEQFADIIKQYTDMSKENEIKHVAATAVAAAVATATAEYIAKQSNPTMGAKAAAMAAEVADAVAKGDSERAAQAVVATAKSVDEVIAISKMRQSVSQQSDSMRTGKGEGTSPVPKSTMCVIL